ncbi:MAG: hypothetical protein ACR2HF_12815, partial [Methylococcaceae bacterium]
MSKKLLTAAASLMALATSPSNTWAVTPPDYQTALVRCTDTTFSSSSMGTCGGDALTVGTVQIKSGNIVVNVTGALADPFTLYEVYWLPIGHSVLDAVLLNNFTTNCKGTATSAILKKIVTAKDAVVAAGSKTNMYTAVGNTGAGSFIVYSRGPYGVDTTGKCVANTYNTTVSPTDTKAANTLANPPVLLGVDEVQFISGYTSGIAGTSGSTGTLPNGTGTGTGTPPKGNGAGTGNGTGTGTGTGTPPNGTGTGTGTGTPPNGTGTGTG